MFSAAFRGGLLCIGFCFCSLSRDEFSLKGLYANTPSSMGDEDCNFPPLHTSWSMPLPYSALFYQNQPEVNNYHSTNQRISGTMFTEILPTTSESSQVSGIKRSKDVASQSDFWGLSSESPLASTLTEDDFLDMVLGIYLSSSNQLFCFLSFFISRCCFVALENLLREFLQSYDLTKSANIRGFLS